MTALIDTHLLVWWLLGSAKLSPSARAVIEDPENRVIASVASFWELAIKASRGKIKLDIEDLVAMTGRFDIEILAILPRHTVAVAKLVWHHADPFDRILLAQAKIESMRLLTADQSLSVYGEPVTVI
jgi:PIN domain nuclease of toxin-antitoxin system